MRKTCVLAVVALLALFAALGPSVPMPTYAATQAMPSQQSTLVGTLVAAPQSTRPTTMIIQVGAQTLAVNISTGTRVVDGTGAALGLSALHDGDSLAVVGSGNASGAFDAVLVVDRSTPVTPPAVAVQVVGTYASRQSTILCLANSRVTSSARRAEVAGNSICPTGQLPIYLVGGTHYQNRSSGAATLAQFRLGDTLQVAGTLSNGQLIASLVRDLSLTPPPPAVAIQVVGTYASRQSSILCLANSRVTSSASRAQVAGSSLCPAGQLPVYLIGTTGYQNRSGAAATLAQFHLGDTLQVTGTLSSARLIASLIKDLSLVPPPPAVTLQVVGTYGSLQSNILCLVNAHVTSSASRAQVAGSSLCPAGELPVYLIGSTGYQNRSGAAATLAQFRPGDGLQVTGTVSSARFIASLIKDLSF